jgi:hypothetical protein
MEEEVVGYFGEWKASVDARPNFTRAQKIQMFISPATYSGLVTTGIVIVQLLYTY